jgi:hypothetical protein
MRGRTDWKMHIRKDRIQRMQSTPLGPEQGRATPDWQGSDGLGVIVGHPSLFASLTVGESKCDGKASVVPRFL